MAKDGAQQETNREERKMKTQRAVDGKYDWKNKTNHRLQKKE